MDWIEVIINTKSEAVEAVSGFLHEMGINVSILDPQDIINFKAPHDWVIMDEKLIPQNKEEVIITAYLPTNINTEEKIDVIKEKLVHVSKFFDIGRGQITINKINQSDWENEWKKYYKPIKVGEKVVIKPTWEEYSEDTKGEDLVIELDPGMAFGTGTHETTRMCIKLLEKYVTKNSSVFDIGCGSGILSICASKLGAKEIAGVDLDPVAVDATRKNMELNNIKNAQVYEGNLLDVLHGKAKIIVANIVADVIIYLVGIIKDFMEKDGIFICSGIIKERLDEVKKCLEEGGFEIKEILTEGEWAALAARYKTDA